MKVLFVVFVILFFNFPANAGFWSSVAGGVVANSLTSSEDYSQVSNIDAKVDEKKVQQVLTKLGFYNASIDGNLNSFETRSGINRFQKYYLAEPTGILEKNEIQDILYMHDLFKNYKQTLKYSKEHASSKLDNIYQAFDKLEDKIRNENASYFEKVKMLFFKPHELSAKLKQEMITRRNNMKNRLSDYGFKGYPELTNVYLDKNAKLTWSDSAIKVKKTWKNARDYCLNLSLVGKSDWYLPSREQLKQLYQQKFFLNHVPSGNYWSSSVYTRNGSRLWFVNFDHGNINWSDNYYPLYVRCVRGRQ